MESIEMWTKNKKLIELSEILKSIGHPSRVAILYLLCNCKDKRMTVKGIYNELNMAQPVISRHLGILRNCGLVKRINEGQNIYYELCENNETVKHLANCFMSLKS